MLMSPWLFDLAPAAKWNLWICGYAAATICVADLTAEADWEPRTSLWLGLWLAVAPWLLGFGDDRTAALLHFAAGTIVSLLSAVELWGAERTPPRRFRPGGARHAEAFAVIDDDNAGERAGHGVRAPGSLAPLRAERTLERRKRSPRALEFRKYANRVDRTAPRGYRRIPARARIA
jgi:hypothetical protein